MAPVSYSASAPGKLMITGEHAVLHGYRAVVGAVNRRLTVQLLPRKDRQVRVVSALGTWAGDLDALRVEPPFRFVLAALVAARATLPGGCELRVESEFGDRIGLGSSAAVTVATVAVLRRYAGLPLDRRAVFEAAVAIVRGVQGAASGADVAASVYGGVQLYRAPGATASGSPAEITRLGDGFPLTVLYSGGKETTVDVIAHVEARRRRQPALFDRVFGTMDACADAVASALAAADWAALGEVLDLHQGLHEAIGVCDAHLAAMVHGLRRCDGVHGAKISGSGLGDCVIAAGQPAAWPVASASADTAGAASSASFPGERIDLAFTPDGVLVSDGRSDGASQGEGGL